MAENDDADDEEEIDDSAGIDLDVALEQARFATGPNGAIQGNIRNSQDGDWVPGVTVVVTSPSLQGAQAAVTDDNGFFRITELPSGPYIVTTYYLETTIEYSGIDIAAGKTTPFFHTIESGYQNVVIRPTEDLVIEPSSTITFSGNGTEIILDDNYTRNIPVRGRTFESALGGATDEFIEDIEVINDHSVSFSSHCGLENTYIVDEATPEPAPEAPQDPDAIID